MNPTLIPVLAGFLLLAGPVSAQNLIVAEESTGRPLPLSTVTTLPSGQHRITNEFGVADLTGFGTGDSLLIRHVGYHPVRTTWGDLNTGGFVVRMKIDPFQMDEVVVSASRFSQTQDETSRKVTVITGNEIGFRSPQTTADLLQNSGDVFVQKSQAGGGSPVLRGFEANKILLMVDGIRMNTAIYRGGHLQNILTVDPASLAKAEVLYGPGSVQYGSDALGGVIHLFTPDPVLSATGRLLVTGEGSLRYSSVNTEKTVHGSVNIGLGSLASFTSVTRSEFGDLRQGRNRNPAYGDWGKRTFTVHRFGSADSVLRQSDPTLQSPTAYTQYDLVQKVLYRQSDDLSHLLNLQISTSTDIPRYDRLTETGSGGKPKSAEWYYGPQDRFLGAYTGQFTQPTPVSDLIRLTGYVQKLEESRHNRNFGSAKLNHRTESVSVLGLTLEASKQLEAHSLSYGIEFSADDVRSRANQENILTGVTVPLDTRYPQGGSTQTFASGWVSDSWKNQSGLTVTAGARATLTTLTASFGDTTFFPFPYSSLDQRSFALTGQTGISWLTSSGWKVTGSLSSGFRAPNVDDAAKVFESVPGSVLVPNPDLKPEYSLTGEAGLTGQIFPGLKLDLTGYYTRYTNALTTRPGTFNGQDSIWYDGKLSRVTTQVNGNSGYVTGGTGSLTAGLSDHLQFFSVLTYTFGRLKTGGKTVPLDHIPPVYGRTGLTFLMTDLRAEVYALYNGWKHLEDYNPFGEDNLVYSSPYGTPAWWTLNGRVSWQATRILTVQVSAENWFDQNYRVFASGIGAPGRNVSLALKAQF